MHVKTQGIQQLATKLIKAQGYWNVYYRGEYTLVDEVSELVRNRFNPTAAPSYNPEHPQIL